MVRVLEVLQGPAACTLIRRQLLLVLTQGYNTYSPALSCMQLLTMPESVMNLLAPVIDMSCKREERRAL